MAVNADGFYNTVIGHGMREFDPMQGYHYSRGGSHMTLQELDDLFTFNGIANKIVSAPANEAVRNSADFKGADKADLKMNDAIQSRLEDLKAWQVFAEALSWDRLFGGAVVLMMCDDGGELAEPLRIESLRSIKKLEVFEPPEVRPLNDYIIDAKDPDYGKPEHYNLIGYSGNSFTVHRSRLLIMRGDTVSKRIRRARDGWGGRVFDKVRDDLVRYDSGLSLSLLLLSRLSQGVLKLDGMSTLLQTDEGEQAVQKRLHLIDMARHIMNTMALDSADEYKLENISLAGVDAILQQFQLALCAVTDIPATVLFGRSPSGENATGKSDQENYFAMVSRIQQGELRACLVKLVETLGACSEYGLNLPDEWTVEFRPLWVPSALDKATVASTEAQSVEHLANAARTLHDLGALDASEVREKLKTGDTFVIDDSLDKVVEGTGNADNNS